MVRLRAGNQPIWYTGTFTYQATLANGVVLYGGNIYMTTGPAIGTPFNPALVGYRQVGLATLDSAMMRMRCCTTPSMA